jgi:hypothetical protein
LNLRRDQGRGVQMAGVPGTFHCPKLGGSFCTDGLLNISWKHGYKRRTYLGRLESILALFFSLFLISNGCEFFVGSGAASQLDLGGLDSTSWKGNGLGSGWRHLVQVK